MCLSTGFTTAVLQYIWEASRGAIPEKIQRIQEERQIFVEQQQ